MEHHIARVEERAHRGATHVGRIDAKSGKVDALISKDDIEAICREAATLAAKQQWIKIEDLQLDLKKAGPRAVAADVRVTAKKMMMTGVIRKRSIALYAIGILTNTEI